MNYNQLRKLSINILTPVIFAKNMKLAIRIANEKSYYPERQRKSRSQRIKDNLSWLLVNKEVNLFYNLYGFDIKDFRNQNEYLDYYSFMLSRGDKNRIHSAESETCLLRDKLLFYEVMLFNSIPVPEVFALVEDGKVKDLEGQDWNRDCTSMFDNCFIKDRMGECASFVKHIHNV